MKKTAAPPSIVVSMLSHFVFVVLFSAVACLQGRASASEHESLLRPKEPRIVNGYVSNPTRRSFYVKPAYDQHEYTPDVLCGATLIAPDIVITAAHCQGAFNHGVLVLDEYTNDFTRFLSIDHQRRHPGWEINRESLNFDILLLRLTTPLTSTDVAQPIPINTNSLYPSNRQRLKAYGFGITEDEILSPILKEAEVTYINNEECWGRGIRFNNVMKGDDVMCTDPALGEKTATCLGDSGGPLTDEFGKTLIGVISFGSGCEADSIPDGHVRLSEVAEWVERQICSLSAVPPVSCLTRPLDSDITSRINSPQAVQISIDFNHDFFPEDTTFAVRKKETFEIVYAGPEYIPRRNGDHTSTLYLLPGEYTFEIYDSTGNGLVSGVVDKSVREDGSWTLSALYEDDDNENSNTEEWIELARGGPTFNDQQVTKFIVAGERRIISNSNDNNIVDEFDGVSTLINACLANIEQENTIGASYNTKCECTMNDTFETVQLTCTDVNNEPCGANHDTCDQSSDCCSGRTCRNGICRSRAPSINSRSDQKIGGTNIGGSGSRVGRNSNLRRGR